MAKRKIAMVLSGSGNKDGSEITEAVSAIICLSELGAELDFFAPNLDFDSVNFLTGELTGKRNAILESARISRSQIQDLFLLDPKKFDGLILPGGMGAVKNLSSWSTDKSKGKVIPELDKCLKSFHSDSRPIAAICIAPVIVALSLGDKQIEITLGPDSVAANEAKKTGAILVDCPVDDYVTDRLNKVITTPAYMYDQAKPHEVYQGIRGLCLEFLEMA